MNVPIKISPFNQAVFELVDKVKPLLAGHDPSIQGAVCGELASIWLAGHTPDLRDELLELHLSYRGDRTSHAEPAELTENPPRIPRPEQPRPPGIEPESGICRVLTTGGISIRFAPKAQRCPHDWPFEDVEDSDRCRWCGMSFIHHLFTDLP